MSLEWIEELAIETLAEENNTTPEYVKEHIEEFVCEVGGI